MKQRGRKSAAALAVADAESHLMERPAPPADLTAIQRGFWLQICNALPADWFGPDNAALLGEYVRTLASLQFLNAQLDEQEGKDKPEAVDLPLYLELMKRRESLVRIALSQATKMRLTQQARILPRSAGSAVEREGGGNATRGRKKPWQLGS